MPAEARIKRAASRYNWNLRFETWAKPLSDTEVQKCQNAEKMIRLALEGHKGLDGLNIDVFATGSYKANTNVRADSDVDICARCSKVFHFKLPTDVTKEYLGFSPAELDFSTYKAKVRNALFDHFGFQGVTLGKKAFSINENTYRIPADVVPAFEYRRYYWENSKLKFISGVCFITNDGEFIVNWPEQTYANGVAKNERTGRRYKKVVRVLKKLRNEMEDKGYASAKKIPSFQIACLAYNIDNNFYKNDDLYDDVKQVAGLIWYETHRATEISTWTEIDEIKSLFSTDKLNQAKEISDFFWNLMQYAELEG